MSEIDLLRVDESFTIEFHPEPAYNALCSLTLLNEDLSGFSPWVEQTKSQLTPEELEATAESAMSFSYLEGKRWESFPGWLDAFAALQPDEIVGREICEVLIKAERQLAGDSPLPSQDELRDWKTYESLVTRLYENEMKEGKREHIRRSFERIEDPEGYQRKVYSHLGMMWERFLEAEWRQNLRLVEDSVRAFQAIGIGDEPKKEIVKRVSGRSDLPSYFTDQFEPLTHIVFVPSVHIGPYLLLVGYQYMSARLMIGARIPRGSGVSSPALSRTELITRLAAVGDEARLKMLEYIAHNGGTTAQDIMTDLDMSQSSASRHLSQLAATGYVNVEVVERTKRYSVNQSRVDDTFAALKEYLT